MPFKMYANKVKKENGLFQSSHRTFKAVNVKIKISHFGNDWHFETGDTASTTYAGEDIESNCS